MSISRTVHALLAWILPRHFKRFMSFLAVIGIVVVLWKIVRRGPSYNYAVACKARIADIVLPRTTDKQAYLQNLAIDAATLEQDYFHMVTSQTQQCYEQTRIGPEEDGGWQVCLYREFEIKKPCLVYSFGIGHDFRFEHGIEAMLGCEVHAFDPSMGVSSHKYSENGYFHDIGIHSENGYAVEGQWVVKTLSTIMKELNHTGRTIDYLKLDVEFSEWPALYNMLRSGSLSHVRQMVLETHTAEMDIHERPDHACSRSTHETYAFMAKILAELRNLGFHIYYTQTNHRTMFLSSITGQNRYCCYNIHMVNKKHPQNVYKPPKKAKNNQVNPAKQVNQANQAKGKQ